VIIWTVLSILSGIPAMLSLHLDLPRSLAAAVTERAAALGTTPEMYILALVQRVMIEDALAPRHGRRSGQLVDVVRQDIQAPRSDAVLPSSLVQPFEPLR
jgi:hypothetical protein